MPDKPRMTMNLRLIAPATEDPISLNEARLHVRLIVDPADTSAHPDDSLIKSLIAAAGQRAEHLTGRALMTQTWELALDRFAPVIELDKSPVQSIGSVKYLDGNGALQTLDPSAYVLDDFSEPGRLLPATGRSWPATLGQINAVRIQFTAGYENAAEVPQAIRQWMLLLIGTLYENRESVIVGASIQELPHIDGLLDRYKVWR
ncbi:hypothetical protein D3870_09730 [Noviherbaspirillum cavernae]|uniref:Phage gp6-like head-tail connector protein n=1 Tax=Noviherbaspirillum cavernae TaxID=2320862 RepID=A0A418X1C1_9BURK|nr:hypothetical protein [Noviherbaspirillum cavernae]RJG06253.1 hypothetical protein D3870_09730 [Noviherbaspirillum cavernae]